MAHKLVELIFNQFIDTVDRLSKNCDLDRCDFNYRVREMGNSRFIDVVYVSKDECHRRRSVEETIDITNICFDDVTKCTWVHYIEKLAATFVENVCPVRLTVVKDHVRKCREQPPCWEPFPCRNTTTIIRREEPVCHVQECEIIIENACECIPVCPKRQPCCPKQHVIIRHEPSEPICCSQSYCCEQSNNTGCCGSQPTITV